MALPQAVARKAERAAELMRPAAPAQPAAGEDATKLKAELDKATKELADVSQKYRSLQGTHKEQLALQDEIKRLTKVNEDLQTKLDEPPDGATTLTDDERRLAGDDMLKIFDKVATSKVQSEVKKLIKPLGERFDQFQRMNEAQYWATVDYFVPDFKAQNDDPKFMAWLQEIDPKTDQLRHDLLRTAHTAMMGYRVAEIFRAYKEAREIGARSTEQPAPPPPPPGDISPAPGSGAPAAIPNDTGKRSFTRAEIKSFYNDMTNKRARMSKAELAEARKQELEINAAVREGRVTG